MEYPNITFANKILELKKDFYGAENEGFEKEFNNSFHPALKFSKKLQFNGTPNNGKTISVLFPEIPGIIFQNPRTNIPDHLIEYVNLEIGGQRIDHINNIPIIFKYFRKIFGIQDNSIIPISCLTNSSIPFLNFFEIKLFFTFSKESSNFDWSSSFVSIDIIRSHFLNGQPTFSNWIYQIQYQFEDFKNCKFLRLCFNHIIYGLLLVDCDWKPNEEFYLTLNGKRFDIPDNEFIKLDSGVFYIHLYDGINFSMIDNCQIIGKTPRIVYAISGQAISFANGMAGLRWSK